jgi:hypothetical protein
MRNLNVFQSNDHERWLSDLNEAVGRGLAEDIAAEWHAAETKVSLRHVNLNALVLSGFGELLRKALEQPVKFRPTAPFLLFSLEFVFISILVSSLAVTSFVELNISRLPIELNIFCLLLVTHNDGVFEVNMDNDDEFVLAGLEKEMANVGEENIDSLLSAKRRLIADTILVYLDFSRDPLALHRWAYEDII